MKKRYLILAGLLAVCITAAAGCNNNREADSNSAQTSTETPTPTPEADNVVQMEAISDADKAAIKNILGEKTSTSSDVVLTNETGLDISEIYIREAVDSSDDEWGDDLIQGEYEWADGDRALYYYEESDSTNYDIQIFYTDEDEANCFFRDLDFSDTTEITLRMQDGVPYVTYYSESEKKEVSTLQDARERMGLSDGSDEDTDSMDNETNTETTATPTPAESDGNDDETQTTPTPGEGSEDPGSGSEDPGYSSDRDQAESFIGKSLDTLEAAIGGANDVNYETDPETGTEIGYHEYDDFTVATTVGEDGQEIVTSVW